MLLSFVAGYVDTVGFVGLVGLFTAHVTGNLVLIGAALVRSHHGLLTKLAALPVFVLGVAATTVYVRRQAAAGKRALPGTLVAQQLLLAGFAIAGIAASPIADADAPLAMAAGLLGVAAMSIQNAASRLLMAELPPTTVMTGGVTQLAIDLAHHFTLGAAPEGTAARQRLARFAPPVLAFALGAIGGALAYHSAGFAVLVVPMAALLAVLLLSRAPQAATARA